MPYHTIPYQDVKVKRKDTNLQMFMGFNLSARSAGIELHMLNTKLKKKRRDTIVLNFELGILTQR